MQPTIQSRRINDLKIVIGLAFFRVSRAINGHL